MPASHDPPQVSEKINLTVQPLEKGRYRLNSCETDKDLADALALRSRAFGAAGGTRDAFDAAAIHVIIRAGKDAVCAFRLCAYHPAQISQSYAAQFYDLSALAAHPGPLLELGRFCTHPERRDPDILRLAWAAMTAVVDDLGAAMLFGCSSFPGTNAGTHLDAFALLKARYLAPPEWAPRQRAPEVVPFDTAHLAQADPRRGMARMPPLLRTYLMMCGWVSDHAVIDREMDTMHVFTGLQIDAIPDGRKRLLRAMVEGD